MEKKSLRDLVQNGDLTNLQRCDVIYMLLKKLRSREGRHLEEIGCGPDEIFCAGEEISFEPDGPEELLFQAPEVIGACVRGAPRPHGLEQKYFMLGMVGYYLCKRTDYYQAKGLRLLNGPRPQVPAPAAGGCIIPLEDVKTVPFGEALSLMTAFEPARRVEGVKSFLQFLLDNVTCRVNVQYVYKGRVILTESFSLNGVYEKALPPVITVDGAQYHVEPGPDAPDGCVLYRPGEQMVRVRVTKVEAAS